MRHALALISLALISCDRGEKVEAPTAAEAERLNDAEAMLDEIAKEKGPAPQGTGPSNSSGESGTR
ncbi:hypothetical protein [Sphingomonas xanthus]|uniref:Lipoprotein n=1 Tax=Sphingomonas xanthus TaxID=2594473 RepID=A0A516IQC3_9SPHN|nr:hypothetical protein [Sphingomonas xanthus]QDP19120.1 hypothetical protein FMM02_03565 [Sphingomonas xanthus]